MALAEASSGLGDTSGPTSRPSAPAMMDRANYGQQAAQQDQLQQQLQLYQELKYRFPGASQTVVLATMQRNGNHREHCLDELSFLCAGTVYQQQQPPHTSSQQAYGNQPIRPGSRSHSVSGVPGGDASKRPYGFRYTADDVAGSQTAPVMSGRHNASAFVPIYHFRPPPMQHSMSHGTILPHQVLSPPKPQRPPVPPPTYRGHFEQQQQYQHLTGDQSSSDPRFGGFPKNVTSPPTVTHKTSFSIAPVYPSMMGVFEEWEPPQQQQIQQQQQQAWNVGHRVSPTSTGVGSHQLLQITTPGHGTQRHHQPQQQHQPYHQSRLHISISPNGNSITSGTPPRRSSIGTNNATTPPGLPKFQFQPPESIYRSGDSSPVKECPFDIDDPEQESLSHKPLRPQPSPTPGMRRSISGTSSASSPSPSLGTPCWPNSVVVPVSQQPPMNPGTVSDDEAFGRALVVHQKDRLGLLQRELSRENHRLQEALTDVTNMELQLFRRRTQFHDQVFPTFDDIQRLWSEIRSYSVDCVCMSHVVDHLHKGQVPLGETSEDFYKSINTGQQGQVLPPTPIARQVGGDKGLNGSTSVSPSATPTTMSNDHESACPHHGDAEDVDEDEERDKWSCSACTFLNNHALDRCEMCEMPRVVLGGLHNLRIHVRQSPPYAMANNKALQLKLTHKLGLVRR